MAFSFRFTLLIFFVLLATAVASLVAQPSRADLGIHNVTCTGTQTLTFTPGLTYEEQEVEFTLDTSLACVSVTDPDIISGLRSVQGTIVRSCNDLLNGNTVDVEIVWNTGETSHVTINYTVSYINGQYVQAGTGVVTAGRFQGSPVTDEMTVVGDLTACGTPEGLTSLFGPAVFTVLR